MRKIIDEFSNLPVSRQRKWALRKRKQGRCVMCGRESFGKSRCYTHYKDTKIRAKLKELELLRN